MRSQTKKTWAQIALRTLLLTAVLGLAPPLHAADDTARFYGNWKAVIPFNGQVFNMISVHDSGGFKNYVVLPSGTSPAGEGTFSAANGRYTTSAPARKVMKAAFRVCKKPVPRGRKKTRAVQIKKNATLQFVIPTEAQRSGGIGSIASS